VAFRADIDALPVTEPAGLPFQSLRPGLMHACGHDAHTAILLGLASFFARHRADFSGTVKLLFQPDEEGEGGADIMVRAGLLESPHAERVFGLHVQPYLDVGEVETRKGPLNGSSTSLGITVRGSSSHGAYPEKGVDAILLAAHVVLALNELVSRYVSPLDSAVLTIGTMNGGSRSNIIAGEVNMKATLRSAEDGLRDSLIARARSIVEGIPAALGGSGSLEVRYGYASLVNHDAEVDLVASVAGELFGPACLRWKEKPSMGVEDFSFFIKDRPGAFYHLGCGSGPKEGRAMLHSPDFILDEACLALGVALQAGIGMRSLE
jgi:amidohydrolase